MADTAATPSSGRIDIWWVDARAVSSDLDAFDKEVGLLAPDEANDLSDMSRWARIVLRLGLSRYGDPALTQCPIDKSKLGRPFLVGSGQPDFSLSHSATHIAVAISKTGRVGIDIEQVRPLKMSTERQRQIMSQAREHGLDWVELNAGFPDPAEFLSVWTKLEAVAKARGDGIGTLLSKLKQQPTQRPSQLFTRIETETVKVHSLSLADNFASAVVRPKHSNEPAIHHLPRNLADLLCTSSIDKSSN